MKNILLNDRLMYVGRIRTPSKARSQRILGCNAVGAHRPNGTVVIDDSSLLLDRRCAMATEFDRCGSTNHGCDDHRYRRNSAPTSLVVRAKLKQGESGNNMIVY